MTTRTPKPSPGPSGGGKRRPFSRLRDAKIRSKLSLILVVPVVTILGLAGLRLVDSGQRALQVDAVGKLTALSAEASGLAHDLHRERMEGAAFLASSGVAPDLYNQSARRTDARIGGYRAKRDALGAVPGGVEEHLRRVDEHLAALNGGRQEVLARQGSSVAQIVLRYGVIITDLLAYREEVGQVAGDTALADALRASAAFSKAKVQTAEEQAIAFAALSSGVFDNEQYSSFLATLTSQQEAFVTFTLAANEWQRGIVESTVTGDAVELASRIADELGRSAGGKVTLTAKQVSDAIGAVSDLMRWTEERLDADTLAAAVALRETVLRQVIVESGVVLVTLILAVAFALLLARSMARSLGRLREGALLVAHRELPEAVARLRDVQTLGENSPDEIARQVRDPIRLASRDEIGQVGQAFNVVHREAVRVAAEQAALRTSVSAMFLNLARRSQTLVDKMIGELDMIERTEEDPKRLSQLFQLDHLATRMRRNDENLLVLAGADSSAPRREDALLVDVLRAAQSEVELYDRIEFGTVDTDVSVSAHAVNDIVRLVAELLDNATRFSPPNTTVVADARRIGDYVLVQVEDHGLGLSDEQMYALNTRLAAPSSVDVSAFRMMGLAVVGRLASRYDVRVELRRNAEGGTVANVALPSSILVLPKIRGREPLMLRQPRAPLAVEPPPAYSPVPDTVPAGLAHWPPADGRLPRPPIAVGMHVTGAAASSAAAAAGTSMPVAGPPLVAPLGGYAPVARVDDTTELPIYREMEAAWFRTHGPLSTDRWATAPASAPPSSSAGAYAPASSAGAYAAGAYAPASGAGAYASAGYGSPSYASAAAPASGAGGYPGAPAPGGYGGAPAPGRYQPAGYPPPPVPPGSDPTAAQPTIPRPRDPSYEWQTAADAGWQAAATAAAPQEVGTTRSGLPKRKPGGQLVPGGVEQQAQSRSRRTPEEVRGLLSAYHRGVQRGRASDTSRSAEGTD